MRRKKALKHTINSKYSIESGIYYYFCGILIGIIFICFFNLFYIQFAPRSINEPSLFSFENLNNNPKNLYIPILMYHYIEVVQDPGDTIRKSLSLLPWTFEEQVKTLKAANYTFITPKDLNLILENKIRLPKKPIILSFDDGYRDFYTDVFPILKKYKVRAVQYIITQVVGEPNYMTSGQIQEIKKSGLVELACHTRYHPALKVASVAQATDEIEGCRRDLAEKFGVNSVSFAYPYGSYDPFLYSILARAGFKNAVTTEPGANVSNANMYNIPRLRPGNKIGNELTLFLESTIASAKPNVFVKSAEASEQTGEYR